MASRSDLNWQADSRGIEAQLGIEATGPVSIHVLKGLADRGIEVNGRARLPLQLQESDLAEADLIIAMKEGEHRSYLEANFPSWTGKIEYWNVHDVDVAPVNETLSAIESNLRVLIQRLSGV